MACACKSKPAGQVTSRKQVIKTNNTPHTTQTISQRRLSVAKRVVYKRPI